MSMTEEEQIAQMKDWWQRNGKPLLTGGVLALAAVIGWQGWQNYQANQAQGASAADLYRVFAGVESQVLVNSSRGVLAAGPSVEGLAKAAQAARDDLLAARGA